MYRSAEAASKPNSHHSRYRPTSRVSTSVQSDNSHNGPGSDPSESHASGGDNTEADEVGVNVANGPALRGSPRGSDDAKGRPRRGVHPRSGTSTLPRDRASTSNQDTLSVVWTKGKTCPPTEITFPPDTLSEEEYASLGKLKHQPQRCMHPKKAQRGWKGLTVTNKRTQQVAKWTHFEDGWALMYDTFMNVD